MQTCPGGALESAQEPPCLLRIADVGRIGGSAVMAWGVFYMPCREEGAGGEGSSAFLAGVYGGGGGVVGQEEAETGPVNPCDGANFCPWGPQVPPKQVESLEGGAHLLSVQRQRLLDALGPCTHPVGGNIGRHSQHSFCRRKMQCCARWLAPFLVICHSLKSGATYSGSLQ